MNSSPTLVLSVDAGGIRAPTIASIILQRLEKNLGKNSKDVFHIFAGSSGGSLTVTAAAMGMSGAEIQQQAFSMASKAFKRGFFHRLGTVNGITGPKYEAKPLMSVIDSMFGKTTEIQDVDQPLCIPVADLKKNHALVIKSHKSPHERLQRLTDVLYSSCAAPTYFPFMDDRYADGGLFAYSGTLCGLTEARNLYPYAPIKVLSIGSGKSNRDKTVSTSNPLSLMKTLVTGVLETQVYYTNYIADRVPTVDVHRIEPVVRSDMDDTSEKTLQNLIMEAEKWEWAVDAFCDTL